MIESRTSGAQSYNAKLSERPAEAGQTNSDWIKQHFEERDLAGWVLLVGGATLDHFRLRAAQSHVRRDMLPSFWSHAAIVGGRIEDGEEWEVWEVPLDPGHDLSSIPFLNGVRQNGIWRFDDPDVYPNLALIRFCLDPAPVLKAAEIFRAQRATLDIPGMIVQWLAFAWGVGHQPNPLFAQTGIPSAAFVEAAYALAELEITPGLSSRASCPEAIWQAGKWWHEFYESAAGGGRGAPEGAYVIRQRAAAPLEITL
jgi:hypothetical protein